MLSSCTSGNACLEAILFPSRLRSEPHVHAAIGQARPSVARARGPRALGARGHIRAASRAEPRRAELLVLRRAGHREQEARRAHGLGPHAQGRLPALQGDARLRPAVPERLRLPGALDRGRRRAAARAELEARDRGVRAREVRPQVPRGRDRVGDGSDEGLAAARHVDGLGRRLLHVQRHEHRVRLADAEDGARARLAREGPPLDRVVPALRHVALAARAVAVGRLPGSRRPVALRAPARRRPARRVARRLDDDAVDAARERRRRRAPRGRVRPPRERRVGRRRPLPGRGRSSRSFPARRSSAGPTPGRSTRCRPARASSTA